MPIGAHRKPVAASKEANLRRRVRAVKAPEASEAEIQRAICDYLMLSGVVHCVTDRSRHWDKKGRVRASRVSMPGFPDIVAVVNGRFIGLEVKARKGRLSPDQIACHEVLRDAGAVVTVVRSVDDVIVALKQGALWC